jgi:hypothetical protein
VEIGRKRAGQWQSRQLAWSNQACGHNLPVIEVEPGCLLQPQFKEMDAITPAIPHSARDTRRDQRARLEPNLLCELAPSGSLGSLAMLDTTAWQMPTPSIGLAHNQ